MVRFTLGALRRRPGGVMAAFVSLFLGATIVMAFASLLDTAAGDGVSNTDREALVTLAGVVGGWGLIIVAFAVASTLTLTVRQRRREMALLRSVGATPRQVRRMILVEAAVVALVAGLAAVPGAVLAGRVVFDLLQGSGQVADGVDHSFGPVALGTGLGVTFVSATLAAVLAARRTTRLRARDALVDAEVEAPRTSRKAKVAAGVFLALGIETAVLTATLFHDQGADAMQTGGQASIWFAIGLAILAPALLRVGTAVLAGPIRRLGGAAGYLAVENLRQRSHQMAGALRPVILFTAIATGTLVMQAIENAATADEGLVKGAEDKSIETLNLVVVGMIAVFAAIMLVNTLVAATAARRREFGQQRLVGATPPQVVAAVGLECVVLAATGVAFGTLASLATIVPYAISRTSSAVPDTGAGLYLAIVAAAVGLTLAATLGTVRRTLATPAVEAVTA